MKKKDISTKIYIAIFCIIIILPLFSFNMDKDKILSLENKRVSQRPLFFGEDGRINKDYITEFESYINDNIGFKENFLELDTTLMYGLFKDVNVKNYRFGKNDELYYLNNGYGLKNYMGIYTVDDSMLVKARENYTKFQQYLEKRGIRYYFITIPDKEGVYFENYIPGVLIRETESFLDKISYDLKRNTDIPVLNLKDYLIEQKGDYKLYYNSIDPTHWNSNGVFFGYRTISNFLKQDFVELDALEKSDFEIREKEYNGPLGILKSSEWISSVMKVRDTDYVYELKNPKSKDHEDEIDKKIKENYLTYNDEYHHYKNEDAKIKNKVLIFGDSYFIGGNFISMASLLGEHFSDVYILRFNTMEKNIEIINMLKPDILITESVERAYFYWNIMGELDKL